MTRENRKLSICELSLSIVVRIYYAYLSGPWVDLVRKIRPSVLCWVHTKLTKGDFKECKGKCINEAPENFQN